MITLVSAKGSPGVTTLGVAMACARPDSVLVEMDPAGGDLALRAGVSQSPGLSELAVRARREHASTTGLDAFAQRLGSGVRIVAAPVGAGAVSSMLSDGDQFSGIAAALNAAARPVVVDAGRFGPHVAAFDALATMRVVVARCDAASLGHAQALLREIGGGHGVGLVLVEYGGFRAREAAAELGAVLLGVLPWHPRHAEHLTGSRTAQTPRVNRLVRAAASILYAAEALATASAAAQQGNPLVDWLAQLDVTA